MKLIEINPKEDIVKFIGNFSEVADFFMCGYCWYYAKILEKRFGGTTMYIPAENHFVQNIKNRLYDVRGDVTDMYSVSGSDMYKWSEYMFVDILDYARVVRDCILKVP